MSYPAIAELQKCPQWVAWRYEERGGKLTKPPFDARTGESASTTDPATWCSYDLAAAASEGFDGIGLVVSGNDPYVGVDLDHCIDENGEISPWALAIVERLNSYTEITPSKSGLRVWVRGTLPAGGRRKGSVEMYGDGRYFTVTTKHLGSTPTTIEDRQAELEALHAELFPPVAPVSKNGKHPECPTTPLDIDDATLLSKAMRASDGEKFAALWRGDVTGYSSRSEAELAICSLLRFWTGGDRARMDRLFRRSGLLRGKWDAPRGDRTYGERTIDKALEGGGVVYSINTIDRIDRIDRRAKTVPTEPLQAGVLRSTETNPSIDRIDRNGDRVPDGACAEGEKRRVQWTATDLVATVFPEPKWAVPGIVAQGLTLFCGAPKTGKSWACYQAAIAVAAGGRAFGSIAVERGDVLYASLEDTERRLKERLLKLLAGEPPPEGLHIWTQMPRTGEGGLEQIREWMQTHPQARLVIVDTLARIRPLRRRGDDVYASDYEVIAALKRVADDYDVALVVVHHTRKMSAEDRQDMVSGSNGLAGAADTTLVLMREANGPVLYGRGRDVEDLEHAMTFDPSTCLWTIAGSAEDRRMSAARKEILQTIQASEGGRMTPTQIAKALGKNPSTVKNTAWQMAQDGLLHNPGDGKYSVSPKHPKDEIRSMRSMDENGSVDRNTSVEEAPVGTNSGSRSMRSIKSMDIMQDDTTDYPPDDDPPPAALFADDDGEDF